MSAHTIDRGLPRNRYGYFLAFLATIAAGLGSRALPELLPAFLGKYPGDALWALMVFFGLGALLPRLHSTYIAALALGIAWAIETLKLWQAPWLVAIRHSMLGHLVFGHVFSWQNLIAYAIGAGLGVLIELCLRSARSPG
jgi:hypothetical protein